MRYEGRTTAALDGNLPSRMFDLQSLGESRGSSKSDFGKDTWLYVYDTSTLRFQLSCSLQQRKLILIRSVFSSKFFKRLFWIDVPGK